MAGVSGDGSYEKLIGNIYGARKAQDFQQNLKEYDSYIDFDHTIKQLQLSYIKSGYYSFSSGNLNGLRTYGVYWSRTSTLLRFNYVNLNPRGPWDKGGGISLRCVAKLFINK